MHKTIIACVLQHEFSSASLKLVFCIFFLYMADDVRIMASAVFHCGVGLYVMP